MTVRLLALALGAALALFTGCAPADGGNNADAVDQSAPPSSPRLLTYPDNGSHMEAAFDDVLSVNEAGCFALSNGGTIVLPDTWSVSPDGGGVINDDGVEIRLGDHFEAGGGYGGPPRRELSAAERECPSDGPPFSNGGKYSSFATLWGITVKR